MKNIPFKKQPRFATSSESRRTRRGFTLIELLVVIAIIGILSAVVLASLNLARAKARDAERAVHLKELQKALALYYSTNGKYPIQSTNWGTECAGWNGNLAPTDVIPGLVPNYISALPADPAMNKATSKNCILYRTDAAGKDYKLLDYDMTDSASPQTGGSLIDPSRNAGQSWASTECGAITNTRISWAVWSSETSKCW